MPFSRYQIRNEFSLADPELYKAADKDDPEALLEGVAMAGLVGVLRQLGDLAEFAAEIFHDLHEEVMVTATRGHGLLVRVQQLESDFPSIERAFLSQTGHSAFFSSSGVGWHPNLRMEQNLITRGDLPRFVMDSYEECRAPPRLFLLDKFDVAGAGACLKRYTDPSFYKVEASSYEMMSSDAQRDKKTRKTKKKGSQWKNGNTPEPFQPSHVKLHQLLLEERIQNGTCEPARRVKLKKRKSKFPFDIENGKGYMEKVLSSPPEDKLVHEVPLSSGTPEIETFEITTVDPPPLSLTTQNRSPYESPSVDKMVSREHIDHEPENVTETPVSKMPTSGGARYGSEDEEVEEKHISVNGFQAGGARYESDDVASEGDDYEDALATMESEIETDAEHRAESDPSKSSIKQETSSDAKLQSQSSGSRSDSDDESSLIRRKMTSFSYSDDTTTTSVDSGQAFACIEIPFRPRVPATDSVMPDSATDSAMPDSATDSAMPDSAMPDSAMHDSAMPDSAIDSATGSVIDSAMSDNCVDVNSPKKTEEVPVDPEAIIASTSEQDKEDRNSDSTLVISHAEEQPFGPFSEELGICDADMNSNEAGINGDISPDACSSPKEQLTNHLLECETVPLDPGVPYSSEDETEFEDRKTVSIDESESKVHVDDSDGKDDNLSNLEEKTEWKGREPESVTSEAKDVDSNENPESGGKEIEFINSETEDLTFADKKSEEDGLSTAELVINQNSNESIEKKESSEISVISPELDSVLSYDHSNNQFLDGIRNSYSTTSIELNENNVDYPSAKKESSEESVITPELDSVPSASSDNDVDNPSEMKESSEKSVITPELDSVPSASFENDVDYLSAKKESSEQLVITPELDSVPSASYDNDVEYPSAKKESSEQLVITPEVDSVSSASYKNDVDYQSAKKESSEQLDITPELDSVPSASYENDVNNPSAKKESIEESVITPELDSIPSASYENDVDNPSENSKISRDETLFVTETTDQNLPDLDLQSNTQFLESSPDSPIESESLNEVEKLENGSSSLTDSVLVEENVDQLDNLETVVSRHLEKDQEFQDPEINESLESSIHIDFSDQIEYPSAPVFPVLPQLPPINLDEMPPLPPLPPMQWRTGKPSISKPDGGQHEVNSNFPQIETRPSLDPDKKDGNSVISSEKNIPEQIVPKPPSDGDRSQNVSTSGREIFWPSSGSSLPPGDDERPNGIRPMKVQRSRTPLIDAVAAHDKSKLRKVSERVRPLIPKEEERDTLLEQIRAKSFNLKPAVQTRPSIQGPTTNLRVAAILEKANAIRQAFAGSDDDDDDDDQEEDEDDGWSDSSN